MHKSSITNAITFSRQLNFGVWLESCCLVVMLTRPIPMFACNFNYKMPSIYLCPLYVFLVIYRKKEVQWSKSTPSLDSRSTNIHPNRIRELSDIFNVKIVETLANEKMQMVPKQLSTLTSYIGNHIASCLLHIFVNI